MQRFFVVVLVIVITVFLQSTGKKFANEKINNQRKKVLNKCNAPGLNITFEMEMPSFVRFFLEQILLPKKKTVIFFSSNPL